MTDLYNNIGHQLVGGVKQMKPVKDKVGQKLCCEVIDEVIDGVCYRVIIAVSDEVEYEVWWKVREVINVQTN